MDSDTRQLLERGIAALEKLADDPVIQIEEGPPACPHCQALNPTVRVSESEASGPLGEFVVQAQCQLCQRVFYAAPKVWVTVKTQEEVQAEMDERKNSVGNP